MTELIGRAERFIYKNKSAPKERLKEFVDAGNFPPDKRGYYYRIIDTQFFMQNVLCGIERYFFESYFLGIRLKDLKERDEFFTDRVKGRKLALARACFKYFVGQNADALWTEIMLFRNAGAPHPNTEAAALADLLLEPDTDELTVDDIIEQGGRMGELFGRLADRVGEISQLYNRAAALEDPIFGRVTKRA